MREAGKRRAGEVWLAATRDAVMIEATIVIRLPIPTAGTSTCTCKIWGADRFCYCSTWCIKIIHMFPNIIICLLSYLTHGSFRLPDVSFGCRAPRIRSSTFALLPSD